MSELLNKIHAYLIEIGCKEEDFDVLDHHSVYLANEIMEYAHGFQYRVNGEEYANHPYRVMTMYRNLVGIKKNDPFCISKDLLDKNNIPFDGVQEVCLLHDVIEDTDITIEELEEVFIECGFEIYFKVHIKQALINVTHIKDMDYKDYIEICMTNLTSALVKMIDLQDNLNVLTLDKLEEKEFLRSFNYLNYIYKINNQFRFIERIRKYNEEFKNMQK